MKNASKVIVVPGYGMPVAQAQHALREMADALKKEGVVDLPVGAQLRAPQRLADTARVIEQGKGLAQVGSIVLARFPFTDLSGSLA